MGSETMAKAAFLIVVLAINVYKINDSFKEELHSYQPPRES
jgi:hypothetical protein